MVDTIKCFRQVCNNFSKNVIIINFMFNFFKCFKSALLFPQNSVKIVINLIVEGPFINFRNTAKPVYNGNPI